MPSPRYVNPYIAGSAVKGAEMFFGREDIFDFIHRNLVGPHSNNPIVLHGQRRTGKTSVLYQLQRHLGTGYWCVFIDLHGLNLGGMGKLMRGIATAISANLRRDHQVTIEIPDRAAFEAEPTSAFETMFLDQVLAVLGDNQLVLMLDEAVRLDEEVRAGRLEREIFEYLRHLMQHSQRLNFVFSLGSGIEEMAKDYALLFNGSLYLEISFLKFQAARDLIVHPARNHYQVTDRAIDRILQITSGHPYYTQLVCHCLFNTWTQNPVAAIEADHVKDILAEAIELGSANLTYVWQDSTAEEQALMAGLAVAAGSGGTAVTAEEIRDAWRRVDVDVPSQEITRALRSLDAREVISGGDTYSFTVDLQRLWIDKHRRINWVKDDLGEAIARWATSLSSDADDYGFVGLPSALQQRYTVLREFPDPGAGADVLLVRDTAAPETTDLKVIKVYRRGAHTDKAVWAKLKELSSENIVRFVETGTSGGRDYEVMECAPGGNLAQLARARGLMPLSTVTEVVRQISGALTELHGHDIVHCDLKAENVLVRDVEPLDIVLTDFGLARVSEQLVVAASRTGTLANLVPEILLSRGAQPSRAQDWWALGVIVRGLLTGTPPFEDMTRAGLNQAQLLCPVDLSGIADPRALVLCRGLLLRDPDDRWGEAQVREWLTGGTPTVAEETAADTDGIKPFTFQKVQYRERKALARAFIQSWGEAARRYFVAMAAASATSSSWRELQTWLEQFREAEGQDPEGLNAMIDNQLLPSSIPPDVKLLTLVQWLDPGLPPAYRGQPLDQQNLAALAEHVTVDHEPAAEFTRIIGDLHNHDLLLRLARMRDGASLAGVHATWRELDARFRQRAHALAPALPEDARQVTADADDHRRQAALLFLAADPQPDADTLRQHVARQAALLPAPVPWFDQIRAQAQAQDPPDPVDDALLLTLFPLAARYSAEADQDRRQREKIARSNEAAWTEHERLRLEGDPGLPRALAYSGIAAAAMLAMFIASVAVVHGTAYHVPLELASGLYGLIVAGGIVSTEVSLARQLGSDYPYYRPTSGWGRGMQRAGSHVHGAGRGCLLMLLLTFVVPTAVSAAFTVPAVVYIIFGIVHLRSWFRRRKQWLLRHEQEHKEIIGRTA